MYFPNAASGNEWNRMATLSIRFYSLHPWVHCALYKFVIFEIFVVEKSIRTFNNLIVCVWLCHLREETACSTCAFPTDGTDEYGFFCAATYFLYKKFARSKKTLYFCRPNI